MSCVRSIFLHNSCNYDFSASWNWDLYYLLNVTIDNQVVMKIKVKTKEEQLDMDKLEQNKTIYKELLKEQLTQNWNSDNKNIDEPTYKCTKQLLE